MVVKSLQRRLRDHWSLARFILGCLAFLPMACENSAPQIIQFLPQKKLTVSADHKFLYEVHQENEKYFRSRLREAIVNDSNFETIAYENSDLRGIQIASSHFKNFNFSLVNLSGAKIINSKFENGKFSNVNFSGAFFADTVFENCILDFKEFTKAIRINVKIVNCKQI